MPSWSMAVKTCVITPIMLRRALTPGILLHGTAYKCDGMAYSIPMCSRTRGWGRLGSAECTLKSPLSVLS